MHVNYYIHIKNNKWKRSNPLTQGFPPGFMITGVGSDCVSFVGESTNIIAFHESTCAMHEAR